MLLESKKIHTKEIEKIKFGILSSEEVLKMSVCEVNKTKLTPSGTGSGTVYDERMGPSIDSNTPCVTCKKSSRDCPGHFGHIILNTLIIHPLFHKHVVSFLRCICNSCNRLLISEEQMILSDLMKYKSERRFKKLIEKLEKVDICYYCGNPQPKIVYSQIEGTISLLYKEKFNDIDSEDDVDTEDEESEKEKVKKKAKKKENKISIILSVEEIEKILNSVSDDDVRLCGFDPTRLHPRNLILSVFPVIPPSSRPFVIANGNICDDDLTNQLIEIIKANNVLAPSNKEIPDEKRDIKRLKAIQSLKFRILTFCNNSSGKAKHPTNGRPIKGIKERITGKEGLIRLNLMGKRVNQSGRTVIGPDPTLPFGWMGIPEKIAKELTIPEKVTSFNIKYLTEIVNNNKANFIIKNNTDTKINLKYAMFRKGTELLHGDIVIKKDGKRHKIINENIKLERGDKIERNGQILDKIQYPEKKRINISIGDTVLRHLKDGDTVLLNRQPTLHKGSMLAKKIKVMKKGKTFRFNLATTKTFNADFDNKCGFLK